MSKKRLVIKIVLPLMILTAALYVAYLLIGLRKPPERRQAEQTGVPVEVVVAKEQQIPLPIYSTGSVKPKLQAKITPQVSGKIEHVSEKFLEGGFFKKGELFFKIEEADYRYLLQKAKARLAKAKLDLEIMEARAEVAKREWRMQNRSEEEPPPLVLMKPQIENAKAQVESAKAEVNKAMLDLKRTSVTAPFNCIVLEEGIDTGHYVKAGEAVGVIAGTDRAEVKAPILLMDLKWITLPSVGSGGQEPSRVEIALNDSFNEVRTGLVSRSSGQIEEKTRLTHLFIDVQDPYLLHANKEATPGPVLPFGTFVHIMIRGKKVTGFPLPASALREGNNVYVVSSTGRLEIRQVKPIWEDKRTVIIGKEIADGEKIVISPLLGAAPGMKLRIVEAEPIK